MKTIKSKNVSIVYPDKKTDADKDTLIQMVYQLGLHMSNLHEDWLMQQASCWQAVRMEIAQLRMELNQYKAAMQTVKVKKVPQKKLGKAKKKGPAT